MKIAPASFARAALPLMLCLPLVPATAQTKLEQAQRELTRTVPAGTLQACSLITRADVTKATGSDPLDNPVAAGQGGWICNVGSVELKVYSGPKSTDAWESTLRGFKKDKEPRTPAPGFGDGAYFLFLKRDNKHVGDSAILVAKSGNHTLVLSLDAAVGKPAESMRPAAESLMKLVLARMP